MEVVWRAGGKRTRLNWRPVLESVWAEFRGNRNAAYETAQSAYVFTFILR
jgi:hypothetical protein